MKFEVQMRKVRDINIESFREDILQSTLLKSPSTDMNVLIDQYECVLSGLLDKHAPLITRKVKCRPDAPWFNDELRRTKQELRSLERKAFSPNVIEVDRQIYRRK